MKKSRLTYDEWDKVILKKNVTIKFVEDDFFHGYIGKIDILQISEPQIWKFHGEDTVVCQNNYEWISILPSNENFCITAMMNEEKCVLLWYIDIISKQGIDKDGVPFFEDLYLDFIVYPDGCIIEDDRDELEEALEKKDITLKQFELANEICEQLKKGLLSNLNAFMEYTLWCKKYVSDCEIGT
ncbi:MAG: DUF402 domain-containing protein [Clostridiales bacterium]|nr:DUF402 domain-containing protein [Clostridiales bacterium]